MQSATLTLRRDFKVILGNRRSQAAEMVIGRGDAEGSPKNRHRGADQWLYAVSGSGTALVNGRRIPLRRGTLLLVEKGDRHEIKSSGRRPLRTLNLYVPPAYSKSGDALPRGRS